MRRVMVIGCSGSGKSTFARRLGAATGVPVVHIDQLFWRAGWVEAPRQEFLAAVGAAAAGEAWIMDGLNVSSFDLRVPRAQAIVWFRLPRWLCLWRVLRRILSTYGQVRPDMAAGCPERLDLKFLHWVWTFQRHYDPRIGKALEDLGATERVIVIRSDRQAREVLAALAAQMSAPEPAAA